MGNDQMNHWEAKTGTGQHFGMLDGIRGIAILMVVMFHTFYTNPEHGALSRFVGNALGAGWMGVPIFFVLSGFLISYPFFLKKNKDANFWYQKGYIRRRIGKIVPPFVLSIIFFATAYYLCTGDVQYWHTAGRWAMGIYNFVYPPENFPVTYWSLIIEAHFYILLPLLFLFTRGLRLERTTLLFFCLFLALPFISRQLSWPANAQALTGDQIRFTMNRFPGALDYFGWGILFSGILASGRISGNMQRRFGLLGYLGLAMLAITICSFAICNPLFDLHQHPQRWNIETFHLLPSVSTFLMLFFLFDPDSPGARLFSLRWLRFIGLVSYEWFLFFLPPVWLFRDYFGQTNGSIGMYLLKTLLPFALTFGVAVVTYRFYSLPLMNRIRGRDFSKKIP
jgi:peptidoglycan/LPS O-acetylase OafA/YrhL